MTQTSSPEKLQVRIRCAADLFDAVRDPRTEVQLPTLRGIMEDPSRALQFGKHNGLDIIDVLAELTRTQPEAFLHQARLMALLCYREPRAHAALLAEFGREPDGQLAITLANRLAMEPLELTRPVFRPLLQVAGARRTAAALVLQTDPTLTTPERLRIATVLGSPELLPEWKPAELLAWAEEAAQPGADLVRQHLSSNEEMLRSLAEHFHDLPPCVQTWLIPLSELDRVREWSANLQDPAPLRAATQRLLQAGANVPAAITARWLDHPDGAVQLAAIAMGGADEDLSAWIAPQKALPLRRAALRRLGAGDLDKVTAYLDAPEWELRATATELLVAGGPAVVPVLRQLALRPGSSPGRTAAVQALLQLEDADWIEETLLAPLFGQASGQENLRD
jgi:hypothetical protein